MNPAAGASHIRSIERKETRLGPRLALRGKSGAVNTAIKQGPTNSSGSLQQQKSVGGK